MKENTVTFRAAEPIVDQLRRREQSLAAHRIIMIVVLALEAKLQHIHDSLICDLVNKRVHVPVLGCDEHLLPVLVLRCAQGVSRKVVEASSEPGNHSST